MSKKSLHSQDTTLHHYLPDNFLSGELSRPFSVYQGSDEVRRDRQKEAKKSGEKLESPQTRQKTRSRKAIENLYSCLRKETSPITVKRLSYKLDVSFGHVRYKCKLLCKLGYISSTFTGEGEAYFIPQAAAVLTPELVKDIVSSYNSRGLPITQESKNV